MKPNRSIRGSILWKVGLTIVLAAAVIDRVGVRSNAEAQSDPDPEPPTEPGPIPADPVGHTPGTPYPDGPGEIPFDQLDPASQQGVSQADEWAQLHHGEAVHQAWSGYVHQQTAEAKVTKAAYQSGANGLDQIGVEP